MKVFRMDYTIKINEFEGPLDLLLHLVHISNIEITEIHINEITDQYFNYIHKMEKLNINVASEYLVMAATLMEIKSKSLLPKKDATPLEEEEEEISRESLIEKLIEYQKYKEVTKDFKKLEQQRREIYTKSPSKIENITTKENKIETPTDIEILTQAWEKFLERKNLEKPITTKIARKEYSVKKRKNDILTLLKGKKQAEFEELFDDYNKSYIVVTFMSILELAKENRVSLNQEGAFSKIYIELKVV